MGIVNDLDLTPCNNGTTHFFIDSNCSFHSTPPLLGKVSFNVKKSLKDVKIQVKLVGNSYSKWTGSRPYRTADRNQPAVYAKSFLKVSTVVSELKKIDTSNNPQQYPFHIDIPLKDIPPTTGTEMGGIEYFVKVTVSYYSAFRTHTISKQIPVLVALSDLTREALLRDFTKPLQYDLPFTPGKCDVTVNIPKRVFTPLDFVNADLHIRSLPSGKYLRYVDVSLCSSVELRGKDDAFQVVQMPRPLAEIRDIPDPSSRVTKDWKRNFRLLVDFRLANPSLESPLFTVKVTLRVEIVLDDSPKPNLIIEVPIVCVASGDEYISSNAEESFATIVDSHKRAAAAGLLSNYSKSAPISGYYNADYSSQSSDSVHNYRFSPNVNQHRNANHSRENSRSRSFSPPFGNYNYKRASRYGGSETSDKSSVPSLTIPASIYNTPPASPENLFDIHENYASDGYRLDSNKENDSFPPRRPSAAEIKLKMLMSQIENEEEEEEDEYENGNSNVSVDEPDTSLTMFKAESSFATHNQYHTSLFPRGGPEPTEPARATQSFEIPRSEPRNIAQPTGSNNNGGRKRLSLQHKAMSVVKTISNANFQFPGGNAFKSGRKDSNTSTISGPMAKYNNSLRQFRAIYSYKPRNDDELELLLGDIILVKRFFEDGWSLGYNLSSGMEGVIPVTSMCEEIL